jgi:hypothetical protein
MLHFHKKFLQAYIHTSIQKCQKYMKFLFLLASSRQGTKKETAQQAKSTPSIPSLPLRSSKIKLLFKCNKYYYHKNYMRKILLKNNKRKLSFS